MKPYLTKSRYLTGLTCQRLLWLNVHSPLPADENEIGSRQLAGIEIGERARELFEGGQLVEERPWEHDEAVVRTAELMATRGVTAIFEAAFEFDGVRIRADVLERLPRNKWALHEVKSSKAPKQEHYEDLAVQTYVIRGNGLVISKIGVIHIDGDYRHGVRGIDWRKIFKRTDITGGVNNALVNVPINVSSLHTTIRKRKEPSIAPGMQCTKDCERLDQCTAHKPDDWIRWLPRISPTKFANLEQIGCDSVREIPKDFPLTSNQTLIRDALATGKDHISPDLGAALRNFGPPTYYLDFETMNPAIPLYPGTSPYQVIPFQWSLHRLDRNGGLKHWKFLARGDDDPRRECAQSLIQAVGMSRQPILMYSSYERTTINLLKAECPDLTPELDAIIIRLSDLKTPISSHTYLEGYRFSNSIKVVASALSPGFGYDDLDGVADGTSASDAFERLVRGYLLDTENETDLRNALLEYCKRDTLAMIEVHAALNRMARELKEAAS